MAIQYNDDGSMTIKLDDDYSLPAELFRNIVNPNEQIEDMSVPYVKPKDINLETVLKDFDKFIGETTKTKPKEKPPVDIPVDPKSMDDPEVLKKILDRAVNEPGMFDELMERTIEPMAEEAKKLGLEGLKNFNDFLMAIIPDKIIEDTIKNKSQNQGVPGTKSDGKLDTGITALDVFNDLRKANEEALRATEELPEVKIEEAPGANLEENIISKTPVKGEKPDGPDIVLKKKPEPPSKIGKIMDKLLTKDDFLLDLSSRLMKGEGLFPGVVEAAKTQKEADKSAAATALSNILTQATIKEKLKGTDLMREADAYALKQSGGEPGSAAYNKAYTQYMDYIAEGNRDLMSPSDLVMLSMFGSQTGDENLQRYTDALLNQYLKQSGITPDATGGAGGTGGPTIIDSFNTGA